MIRAALFLYNRDGGLVDGAFDSVRSFTDMSGLAAFCLKCLESTFHA